MREYARVVLFGWHIVTGLGWLALRDGPTVDAVRLRWILSLSLACLAAAGALSDKTAQGNRT